MGVVLWSFLRTKSLFGKLAPADFWAQERARAERVASGVRFVRAACNASIKQSTSGRQTSIYDQSILSGAWLLGWLPARSGLIGTVGMNISQCVGRVPDSLVGA
jgi:hypothetical protein